MLSQYAGSQYQPQNNGPLTTNAGDFGAFEKVPADLRSNFTAEALEDLATFPADWPEVEVRCFFFHTLFESPRDPRETLHG